MKSTRVKVKDEYFPDNRNILSGKNVLILLLLILLPVKSPAENYDTPNDGFEKALYINPYYQYAVELSATDADAPKPTVTKNSLLSRYIFYKVKSSRNGIDSYRSRFGFFIYQKSAQKLVKKISNQFKGATVVKVSKRERKQAVINFLTSVANETSKPQANFVVVSESVSSDDTQSGGIAPPEPQIMGKTEMKELIKEAKQALTIGDNKKAISILSRILRYPSNDQTQQAQEYIGLARERLGQFGLARVEYEKYLSLYKTGEGSDRVKQRMNSLLTAREAPKKKLIGNVKPQKPTGKWERNQDMDWSQYYNFRSFNTGDEGYQTLQSNLFSDLYLNTTVKNSQYDVRFIFSGSYENDFLDEEENSSRVDSIYIDGLLKKRKLSARFGRQSSSGSNGISGRFDGLRMTFQRTETIKISAYAGYPVEYPITYDIKNENPFVSLTLDLGTYKDTWNLSGYIFNQQINGITDRRALGGEVHFSNAFSSIYTLFDYDVSYKTVNNLFISGTWFNKKNASFHLNFDFRKSPFISTANALFNDQNFESISELLEIMSESNIREKADENTGFIQSISGGGSYPLTTRLQFYGEINLTKSTYTPDYDIYSSGQFALTDLFKNGNYTTLDSRYYSNSGSDTYTTTLRSRYPFTRNLKVIPRVQFDYRIKKRTKGKRYTTKPSIKTQYSWKRKFYFDIEIGGDWSKDTPSTPFDSKGSFFILSGYRISL